MKFAGEFFKPAVFATMILIFTVLLPIIGTLLYSTFRNAFNGLLFEIVFNHLRFRTKSSPWFDLINYFF